MMKFPPLLFALLFLCGPFVLSATTKTQQVEHYLGKYRYEHDRPKGIVKFIFQKAVLKRNGDGAKTYKQLLLIERFFSNDDNAGRLIGIQVVYKNQTSTIRPEAPDKPVVDVPVKPTKPTKKPHQKAEPAPEQTDDDANVAATTDTDTAPATPQHDPVRPNQRQRASAAARPFFAADSVALANNIDEVKGKINTWQSRMWQTVRPMWEFFMWVFNSIIVLLICLGGLCRYVAKTAASESLISSYGRIIVGRWIVSAHQNAAAMLLIITWIIAIVMLIDVFMWLVYHSFPVWILILIWFPILWVAEKLTSWIVPNIPVLGSGHS
jgi:hypothetical protein